MKDEVTTKIKKSHQTIAMLKKIKKQKRKKLLKKHKIKFISLVICMCVVITVLFILNSFMANTYKIDLDNMNPTLSIDDRVYVDKNFTKIDTGRVYQFKKDGKIVINRCIAMGGDHVVVANDNVFINTVLFAENYVSSKVNGRINMDEIVPEGKLFFLGDNRNNSWDGRYWNNRFVDEDDLIAEVTEIIYPFDRSKEVTYY